MNRRNNNHFINNSGTDKENSSNWGKLVDDEIQNITGNSFSTDPEVSIFKFGRRSWWYQKIIAVCQLMNRICLYFDQVKNWVWTKKETLKTAF